MIVQNRIRNGSGIIFETHLLTVEIS